MSSGSLLVPTPTQKHHYVSLSERVIALHDYIGEDPRELSFKTGEVLVILAKDESGWGYGALKGMEGWLPLSFVRDLSKLPVPPTKPVAPSENKAAVSHESSRSNGSTKSNEGSMVLAKDKELSLKIAVLLRDPQLSMSASTNAVTCDEVALFRSVYFAKAEEYIQLHARKQPPASIGYAPISSDLPPPSASVSVSLSFHFPNDMQKNIVCAPTLTVPDAIREVFRYTHASFLPKGLDPSNCILRLAGTCEYLHADSRLFEVRVILEALKRGQPVAVVLEPFTTSLAASLANAITPASLNAPPKLPAHFINSHKEVEARYIAHRSRTSHIVSHETVKDPLEVRILSCEKLDMTHPALRPDPLNTVMLVVEATIYYGGRPLAPYQRTDPISPSSNPEWGGFLVFPQVLVSNLPRHARLSVTLLAKKNKEETPLGSINWQLVDFCGRFTSGVVFLKMWPNARANPIGPCVEYPATDAITIGIEFSNFSKMLNDVAFSPMPLENSQQQVMTNEIAPTEQQLGELRRIVNYDPLYMMTSAESSLVWHHREYLRKHFPRSLSKVLLSCTWNSPSRVKRMLLLLQQWPLLAPEDALELLDANFPETAVRSYAIDCLASLSDSSLSLYLLQLVQALKYESYLASPLMSFLLERALHNRKLIGHALFWHARAELHRHETSLRYALLLESYLRAAGDHVEDLLAQHEFIHKITTVCQQVEPLPSSRRLKHMGELLSSVTFLTPQRQLPHDPSISVKKFVVPQCKIMDSSKMPLWLVIENADPLAPPVSLLFKANDDLRQDVLVLQMLNIMDSIWRKEGLDLHLTCYKTVATGDKVGFIEAVLNSMTVAKIQKDAGGITAAFKQTPLANWLRESHTNEEFDNVVENFTLSCAGYVVGTYVLGIGDRHNDNIMVNKSGHLFHIDFGHFLGKIKTWAGIKRERCPFIFTPDFAYVMGGRESERFQRFVGLCCRAYNILRKHSNLFINLFAMMLSTGIPELQGAEDIEYLRRAFMLDCDDAHATSVFTSMIYESLNTKATQVNWAVHILVHPN